MERGPGQRARQASQQDVHPGAGAWAVGELFALPADGRAFYRRRYAERATGPRARDRERRPRRPRAHRPALADHRGGPARVVGLGDLEVELEHTADGLQAWARAARSDSTSRTAAANRSRTGGRGPTSKPTRPPPPARRRASTSRSRSPEVGGAATSAHENEATFVLGPATGVAADAFGVRRTIQRAGDDDIAISGWAAPYALPEPFREERAAAALPAAPRGYRLPHEPQPARAQRLRRGEAWVFGEDRLDWNGVRNLRDFEEAVDTDEHIVTVAASRGIVVAACRSRWCTSARTSTGTCRSST